MPAAIGCLTELAKLLLYKNSISSLPEELCKCIKLEELNLFNNKVNSAAIMKAAVGGLTRLKEVNFAANKVMQVKEEQVVGWTEVTCLNWYESRTRTRTRTRSRTRTRTRTLALTPTPTLTLILTPTLTPTPTLTRPLP